MVDSTAKLYMFLKKELEKNMVVVLHNFHTIFTLPGIKRSSKIEIVLGIIKLLK